MKFKELLTKSLLAAVCLLVGQSAWADVIETVGTAGTGDAWESRKYSTAVQLALGETYHYTFTNTSYGTLNWHNWLLDIKASADLSVDDWYLTMRSDNYGWGTSYNSTMRSADFVWSDFKTVMNGATVDMYINFNSDDKIIRTYATITKNETEWHYNFATKAIDAESVYLFLSEELAVLEITTAEKVANIPDGTKNIYKRSVTDGYGYTWDIKDPATNSPDYSGWTNTGGTKTLDLTDGLKLNIGNNGWAMSTSVFPTVGDIINIDATFFLKGGTGGNNDYSNYAYFRFGNIYITNYGQYCYSRYLLNGAPISGGAGTTFHSTSAGSSSIYRTTGINYRLQLEINTKTNKVVTMKVYVNGAAEPSLNISDVALSSYDYSTIELGYNKARTTNGDNFVQLKDISITETPQAISVVDYTVKFQDAFGNTLKADVVHDNGVVGEVYQATTDDMATFYNDGKTAKYTYKSGQNTEIAASSTASENVITLVFDVYDKTAYTVKAQVGGSDLATLASGSAFFDGSTSVYWNKYINVSDSWYVADETTYGTDITTEEKNVAYTATNDIDYFFEFEDMTISRTYNSYAGTSASNGSAKTLYGDANAYTSSTVAAGVYDLSVSGICWQTGYEDGYTIYYSTDQSNWVSLGTLTYDDGEEGVKTLSGVIIPEASYIKIFTNKGTQTPRRYLDYMTLKKTDELPENVSKSISTAGWSTYCSPYVLDFSNSIDNLDAAYVVTGGENGVLKTTKVEGAVPANTGLLLKGTANASVNIPVAATATATVTENKLVGVTASGQTIDAGAGYVLMASGNDAAFYKNKNDFTLSANSAYLPVNFDGNGEARASFLLFGDDVTGISQVAGGEVKTSGAVYNLNGQRVSNPTKGIYIIDGVKVAIE